MIYHSETAKIRHRIDKYLFEKSVIDIGCGPDKVTLDAFGVDGRPLNGIDYVTKARNEIYHLDSILDKRFDVVFSSHVLEHLKRDVHALKSWSNLLNPDGVMLLYLPDDDWYDNDTNPEHVQRYKYVDFVRRFDQFGDIDFLDVIEHWPDVGKDRYSFFVACKKRI